MKNISLMTCLFLIISASINFASQVERARNLIRQKKNIITGNTTKTVEFLDANQRIILTDAVNEANKKISDARLAMGNAQSQFLAGEITADEFDEIIYEQSANIVSEEESLKNSIDEIAFGRNIAQVSKDYWSYMRRSFMAWSGYEVTEEQKKARQDFDILLQQKKIVQDESDLVGLDNTLEATQKNILKERYKAVMNRIDNEISQQQVAITSKWSLFKKAAIAIGAAAAATVAGLLFSNRFLTSEVK